MTRFARITATHLLAAYLGAGLLGGLTMAAYLPLGPLGVAYYTATWPQHLYCARRSTKCVQGVRSFPRTLLPYLFNLPETAKEG